jgi:site-specific recombinase XerD
LLEPSGRWHEHSRSDLEAFFTDRLQQQQNASTNTIASYRDTFRLLLAFAHSEMHKAPSALELVDLDAPFIVAFLAHLETQRGNSISTRNARLAAVHSFFKYVALREPAHGAVAQRVLAIPSKRTAKKVVAFLTRLEFEALIAAPDQSTSLGRRDHVLLMLAIQTGLRVSELISLCQQDVRLDRAGAHVRCSGKRRKERVTPLTPQAVKALRAYLRDQKPAPSAPLFRSQRGGPMSRDAVERVIEKYRARAATMCPTLAKKRVSPHVLRHTNAMMLLNSGVDRSVIALWLGHESIETTEIYLQADMATKERAIAKTAPIGVRQARYRPPDELLRFLATL